MFSYFIEVMMARYLSMNTFPHTPCLFNYQALFKLKSLVCALLSFLLSHSLATSLSLPVWFVWKIFANVRTNVFFFENAPDEMRSVSIRMKIQSKINSPLRYLKMFGWIFIERWLRVNRSYSDLRLNWWHRCHQHIFADTIPIQRLLCSCAGAFLLAAFIFLFTDATSLSIEMLSSPSNMCVCLSVCVTVFGNFPFFRVCRSITRNQHEAFAVVELNPVWVKVWVKA